ncbi:MAG TPA: phytanoyl-CoA dioxygenase family protein [Pseudomonadales bacterium]
MTAASNTASAIAHAKQQAAAGQWREAIDSLSAYNGEHPDIAIEQALIDLRLQGYEQNMWPASNKPWPPYTNDVFAGVNGIPDITAAQLNAKALAGGVLHHGALLVRGLVPPAHVARLTDDIDKALEGKTARAAGNKTPTPWFSPSAYLNEHYQVGVGRKFIADTGGIWAADSPRGMAHVMELYRQLGLRTLLEDYLGDTPCVSVRKWVLRRVAPLDGEPDWHQDGRFMGTDVRSINLWIALSDCGGDSDTPGIDLIPKRLDHITPTGTHGARFDWTVGPALVPERYPDAPAVRPAFKAGDDLFFDHMNLHRTAWSPTMRHNRYAIECWFFAAGLSPLPQIPMLL